MPLSAANNFFLPSVSWRRSFFVTLFFVTLAALLFWLDGFRSYESEVRVIVIGKSAGIATDQVVENLAVLTSNLSFYERVLSGNDLIDDDFAGFSPDKRKTLWNEAVTAKRSEGSSVLVITARQDSAEKAKLLSEETVKTLFSVASFYYTIQTDVDMRIVDGTIIKTTLRSPFQYVLTSFGSALVLTTVFFSLLSVAPVLFGGHRSVEKRSIKAPSETSLEKEYQDFTLGSAVPYIDPRKFVPARPKTLSFESSHEEQLIRQEILAPLTNQALEEKEIAVEASSERMLPGMDVENLPFEFEEIPHTEGMIRNTDMPDEALIFSGVESAVEEKVAPVQEVVEEIVPPVKTGEPTIEEYKRRLNELLSGGK